MANLFYSMLVFGISLQLMAFFFWAFNSFGGILQYPFGSVAQMNSLSATFSLTSYNALVGIGVGTLVGIAALLLRQGTYAIYAMLIFAIGMFFPIVQNFVLVIPNTLAALLPASTNPMPGAMNPIQVIIGVIVLFAGFIYMFELVIQRKVS